MEKHSLENRVTTIIDALKKASSGDSSIAIHRTSKGDTLDLLVDAIEELLHSTRERMRAFQSAQETMTRLQIAEEKKPEAELPREHFLLLKALEENIPDTIYFKDLQGHFIHRSKVYVRAFNLISVTEAIGMTDFDLFTQEHARTAFEDEQRIIRTGEPLLDREEKEAWLDRPARWVLTRKMPLRDQQGTIVGTFGISRDITERKRAEIEIHRINRALRMLSDSNEALIRASDETSLLNETCQVVVEVGGYRMVRVDLAQDGASTFRPAANAGFELGYIESAEDGWTWADNERGQGPGGTAIRTGQPSVVRNIALEPSLAPWQESAIQRGNKSVIALPLICEDQTLGVLGIYSGEVDAFDTKEVEILKELAGNLAFGITALRTRARRDTAEAALRDSEERYRLIAENTADTIAISDLQLEPIYISPAVSRLRGFTVEEAMAQSPHEVLTPESLRKVKDVLDEQMELEMSGKADASRTVLLELEEYCKDGSIKWVELAASFIRDKNLKITGILTVTRDISKRKLAEEELRQSEFRLTRAEKVAKTGNWQIMVDTKQVTASTGARIIYGAEKQKLSLEYIQSFPLPEYRNMLDKALADLITQDSSYDLEFKIRRPNDERIIDLHSIAEYDKKSKTIYGVIQDITERKQAEERIKDLARFPNENPHPIARVSPNGTILYQNPPSRDLFVDQIPSKHMSELLSAWTSGEKRKMEVQDGKKVVEFVIVPIFGRGYINLYGRDVTEERSLAEKLLQAQRMEAVGRLAGGIAHDFNNLLTVIGGYCEIAQEKLIEGSLVREAVDEIANAANRAATLTSQLLAFSRKQVLIPQVLCLNDLVRAIERILTRLVGEDIELKTFLQPDAGDIKADPGQIEQVFMNLAANARDAMPSGGKLTIETSNQVLDTAFALEHPGALPGEYVRISVSDTGQGIDPEVLTHIFEPFFTTKEQGKGTGLGLSTVYGIVRQSAGYITCYSELGKGTTFSIYLPRTAEARNGTVANGEEQIATLGGSETVLLAEDEESVRRFTQTLLENNGYTVIAAEGGKEALAILESKKCEIDLVVTDVVMPHMSGKDLAQKLLLICPRAKVLFVSGYTGTVIVHHGILDAGVDYLQKPFKSQEFLAKIREVLDRP
jgi:PAS domain S-box-containing protein